MKNRYRMVMVGSRGGTFYWEDTLTAQRGSLRTKDEKTAERLLHAKNEAHRQPQLNRRMGMTYLSATDPKLITRIWKDVMEDVIQAKTGKTLKRWTTAVKDEAFDLIRKRLVVETSPEDFVAVPRSGTISTNVYLRRLQNHALDMGWLPVAVLPKKMFPKIKHKEKRASRLKSTRRSSPVNAIRNGAIFTNCAGTSGVRSPTLPHCRRTTSITHAAVSFTIG